MSARQLTRQPTLPRQLLLARPDEEIPMTCNNADSHQYVPSPRDTSAVCLPRELEPLTEQLAAHAHDLWAVRRFSDGWKWGPERNDELRTNPCLVPYDELPESEKRYDREMALGTLKAIVSLGYRVERTHV